MNGKRNTFTHGHHCYQFASHMNGKRNKVLHPPPPKKEETEKITAYKLKI
jgi:hypothetical protein